MNISDADILLLQIRVAKSRDTRAYKDLFFLFHAPLYRFAFNLIKDAEAAEEIVSDIMMKIWDMEDRLTEIEKLNLYLFRSVKNASLTHLSKSKPQLVVIDETLENTLADQESDPEQKLLLTEVEQKIEVTIKNLPPQCQSVFRLIKEEGFSYKEVSALLEISQNTIETHMRIAFKKLRLALGNPINK